MSDNQDRSKVNLSLSLFADSVDDLRTLLDAAIVNVKASLDASAGKLHIAFGVRQHGFYDYRITVLAEEGADRLSDDLDPVFAVKDRVRIKATRYVGVVEHTMSRYEDRDGNWVDRPQYCVDDKSQPGSPMVWFFGSELERVE